MTKGRDFLTKYEMTADFLDTSAIMKSITDEIGRGLAGSQSSIAMIPSYLSTKVIKKTNVRNILLDAGGTNLRCCIGRFDEQGKVVLEDYNKTMMPGVRFEVTKERFYDLIARNIRFLANKGDNIGYCFSYNVDMRPNLDGRARPFSKEIKVSGFEGSMVGANTLSALRRYNNKPRKIAILNDTVATLLGGCASICDKEYSTYIGYIYGTGTNISYVENNTNITKLSDLPEGEMIINTECGNFDKLHFGVLDDILDGNSAHAGEQRTEKMCSGRYISQILRLAIQKGVEDGLFDCAVDTATLQKTPYYIDTASAGNLVSGEREGNKIARLFSNMSDVDTVAEMVYCLIDRAAVIGAILNSAFAVQSKCGRDICCPIAIVAEGTTFYKMPNYATLFEKYMHSILDKQGIYFEVVGGTELNMTGALMASMAL